MQPYRVVRLLRNHIYPTFQLSAELSNKKTPPEDGLKIAALTCLQWLRYRLGEDIPAELLAPDPEDHASCELSMLVSAHINQGFVIDIVSLPKAGIWSLQITEPDHTITGLYTRASARVTGRGSGVILSRL